MNPPPYLVYCDICACAYFAMFAFIVELRPATVPVDKPAHEPMYGELSKVPSYRAPLPRPFSHCAQSVMAPVNSPTITSERSVVPKEHALLTCRAGVYCSWLTEKTW